MAEQRLHLHRTCCNQTELRSSSCRSIVTNGDRCTTLFFTSHKSQDNEHKAVRSNHTKEPEQHIRRFSCDLRRTRTYLEKWSFLCRSTAGRTPMFFLFSKLSQKELVAQSCSACRSYMTPDELMCLFIFPLESASIAMLDLLYKGCTNTRQCTFRIRTNLPGYSSANDDTSWCLKYRTSRKVRLSNIMTVELFLLCSYKIFTYFGCRTF